jgi:hypothetical protein
MQPYLLEQLILIWNSHWGKSFVPSRCAPKSAGTRKSSTYLAQRLATAGLKFAEAMMTRTRIFQRFTRVNLLFSAAHQQRCSSPAATASRRRDNDLGTTIKYLRKTTSGATGIGIGTTAK